MNTKQARQEGRKQTNKKPIMKASQDINLAHPEHQHLKSQRRHLNLSSRLHSNGQFLDTKRNTIHSRKVCIFGIAMSSMVEVVVVDNVVLQLHKASDGSTSACHNRVESCLRQHKLTCTIVHVLVVAVVVVPQMYWHVVVVAVAVAEEVYSLQPHLKDQRQFWLLRALVQITSAKREFLQHRLVQFQPTRFVIAYHVPLAICISSVVLVQKMSLLQMHVKDQRQCQPLRTSVPNLSLTGSICQQEPDQPQLRHFVIAFRFPLSHGIFSILPV